MSDILEIVLPVFLLVGAGYAASSAKLITDAASDAVLGFVMRFAVPCVLLTGIYRMSLSTGLQPLMILSYFTGAVACFGVAFVAARFFGKRPGESVAIGFGSYFSNTLLIGLPIVHRAYGPENTESIYGILAVHAPFLYSFGLIAMEAVRRDGTGAWPAAKRAAQSVMSNPLMIGIAIGLSLNLSGAALPGAAEDALDLMARAALPTALFAMGAAMTRYRLQSEIAWASALSALSLLLHPVLVWLLTDQLFGLDPYVVRVAVIIAAMPAGLNIYIFAAMHNRCEGIAASTVLLSTALSIISVSLWLAFLGGFQ